MDDPSLLRIPDVRRGRPEGRRRTSVAGSTAADADVRPGRGCRARVAGFLAAPPARRRRAADPARKTCLYTLTPDRDFVRRPRARPPHVARRAGRRPCLQVRLVPSGAPRRARARPSRPPSPAELAPSPIDRPALRRSIRRHLHGLDGALTTRSNRVCTIEPAPPCATLAPVARRAATAGAPSAGRRGRARRPPLEEHPDAQCSFRWRSPRSRGRVRDRVRLAPARGGRAGRRRPTRVILTARDDPGPRLVEPVPDRPRLGLRGVPAELRPARRLRPEPGADPGLRRLVGAGGRRTSRGPSTSGPA